MPLFEYQCESCGRRVEQIQALSDPGPAACEACGGPMKKLLSAPAFQFKGSGWYVSDYGRGGGGEKPEGEKRSDGDKTPLGEKKSEETEKKSSGKDGATETGGSSGSPSAPAAPAAAAAPAASATPAASKSE